MRRALLIGIDNYPAAPLNGCVADAERLAELLRSHGDNTPNFDTLVMTAPRGGGTLGKARLRQAIEKLLLHDAQAALLLFSGHGIVNEAGGFLVTSDGEKFDEGISLQQVMHLVAQSRIPEVTILLDCCHSGALGDGAEPERSSVFQIREGVALIAASGARELGREDRCVGGACALWHEVVRKPPKDGGSASVATSIPGLYWHRRTARGPHGRSAGGEILMRGPCRVLWLDSARGAHL